jgi:hypothetical protein
MFARSYPAMTRAPVTDRHVGPAASLSLGDEPTAKPGIGRAGVGLTHLALPEQKAKPEMQGFFSRKARSE